MTVPEILPFFCALLIKLKRLRAVRREKNFFMCMCLVLDLNDYVTKVGTMLCKEHGFIIKELF